MCGYNSNLHVDPVNTVRGVQPQTAKQLTQHIVVPAIYYALNIVAIDRLSHLFIV